MLTPERGPNKTFCGALLAIVLLLGLPRSVAPAEPPATTTTTLFFIQRSLNANEVHYDARVQPDGTLAPREPVVGYWLNRAEDGSRSPISRIQRMAYGHKVEPAADGTWTLVLEAFPERPLQLVRVAGRWRGRTVIGGQPAYLKRIYVTTDDTALFPRVLSLDLFGDDVATGAARHERIAKR